MFLTAFALPLIGATATALPDFPESYGFVDGADFHVERSIAPGITQRFDSWSTGPLTINTVFMAMNRADLAIEVEKAKDDIFGSETLPAMVSRLADPAARPLVAINADFWGPKHVPIGPLVDEGMIWKAPWHGGKREGRRRSVFAFDDRGNLFVGLPDWNLELRSDTEGENLSIPCVNIESDLEGESIVYTYPGRKAFKAPDNGFKQVILRSAGSEWLPNVPLQVTVHSIDGTMITVPNASTFLLHTETVPAWIREGAQLTLAASLTNLPGKVTGLAGGQPRLVEGGKVIVDDALIYEATGKQFLTDMHPRSAVGLLKDGKTLVFCVVDGRQPRKSIGIDLYDLAKYMQSIGCERAMNFDGGGSSSIAVNGLVTNFPSDPGGPRPLCDAVVVRRTAALGPPMAAQPVAPEMTIPTGSSVTLNHTITDASGEAIAAAQSKFEIKSASSSRRRVATVGKDGVVTARSEGEAKITETLIDRATKKKIKLTTTVRVANPVSISFSPPVLIAIAGDEETVRISAAPPSGISYFQNFDVPSLAVDPLVEYDQKTDKMKAVSTGVGSMRAKLGSVEETFSVAVNSYRAKMLHTFDDLPTDYSQSWLLCTNANQQESSVEVDTTNPKIDRGAWRFHYAMQKGGASKIALPINVEIPADAPEVGLWIYGDGNGHMFRADVSDSRGETYMIDFAKTKGGIDWKDTWKFCTASLDRPIRWGKTRTAPVPPLTIKALYIIQPQEAAKKDGTILIDGLAALYIPDAAEVESVLQSRGDSQVK